MDMDILIRQEGRLVMLKALAEQANESLSSALLEPVLARYAIRVTRAWIHMEMDYLAEIGAVKLTDAGSVKIATLTERGHRHLTRDLVLDGVRRPARAEV